jgi:hypothetical protein
MGAGEGAAGPALSVLGWVACAGGEDAPTGCDDEVRGSEASVSTAAGICAGAGPTDAVP